MTIIGGGIGFLTGVGGLAAGAYLVELWGMGAGEAFLFVASIVISVISVIAIVGAAMHKRLPLASWVIPLFACLIGFAAVRYLWLIPGVFLLAGATTALLAEGKDES